MRPKWFWGSLLQQPNKGSHSTMTNQYQKTGLAATLLCILTFILTGIAFSEEPPDTNSGVSITNQEEALPVLPQVTVTGIRIAPMTGATILDREMIENLPARNGTLNELISVVPGVQYSETSHHSFTGGEITPPAVSISGGRFYENNFTIDGFSNNSALEPATTSTNDINVLPGHPQQIFLDPHLIEQITVYDSNIPAEHGGFTGGMVDVETLDPVDEFWGNINYRTTSDNFTKFHIHPDDEEDFENSEAEAKQPKFTKHDGGFTLNTPIGPDMGILASYQRLESQIPLSYLGATKEQSRVSENFFLKYGYHISNSSRLYLTGIYAPSKNEYFESSLTSGSYRSVKDSDYTINGGTYSTTAQFEHDCNAGLLELGIAYNHQKTERDGPQDKFRWHTSTASIDWESGLEGGNGSIKTSQEDFEVSSTFAINEFSTGDLMHQAKIGMEAEHSKQIYNRPATSYSYTYFSNTSSPYYVVLDPAIECNGAVACIDNEQYLVLRYVYEAGYKEASYNRYAAFMQDAMSWYRLELFPGIRISSDNFTDNTNIAPRFSASYDVFGNRKTVLFGGANRYYSQNLLTHKLREAFSASNHYEDRVGLDSDFETANTGSILWKATDLDTPYSDEITLGLSQSLLGGKLKVQYIERSGRDGLAREKTDTQPDGFKYYLLNNNGRTEHESYQASWHRSWKNHYLEINGIYQHTNTSNLTYTETVDAEDVEELFLYEGNIVEYDELPRKDFNRPSVINLIYTGQLPINTTFTSTTKYRGGYYYKKYTDRPSLPDGTLVFAYEERKNDSAIIFDWRFTWTIPSSIDNSLVVSLDIYNVFNEKAFVSSKDDEFEIGRQYWLGMEYNF